MRMNAGIWGLRKHNLHLKSLKFSSRGLSHMDSSRKQGRCAAGGPNHLCRCQMHRPRRPSVADPRTIRQHMPRGGRRLVRDARRKPSPRDVLDHATRPVRLRTAPVQYGRRYPRRKHEGNMVTSPKSFASTTFPGKSAQVSVHHRHMFRCSSGLVLRAMEQCMLITILWSTSGRRLCLLPYRAGDRRPADQPPRQDPRVGRDRPRPAASVGAPRHPAWARSPRRRSRSAGSAVPAILGWPQFGNHVKKQQRGYAAGAPDATVPQ